LISAQNDINNNYKTGERNMLIQQRNRVFIASITIAVVLLSAASSIFAAEPKYKADVPVGLITPDNVQTEFLGELDFFDGMPSESTVKKTYDFLDLLRGVEVFLNGMPAASVYAMLEGQKQAGATPGDLVLLENLMDARTLFLTPQTTTPYAFAELDLKNGPLVVEIPPGVLGGVDDAFFLHVSDVGVTGPDKGKGGKYLFVGPDYDGDIPEGYFVARSKTYRHWLFMRVFVKDGDIAASTQGLRDIFHVYPLAQAENPPKQKIHNVSGKQFNTIHANDVTFYDELNAVVQYEPADAFNRELVGLFASIGIKKGEKFAPDARMKKILTEAAVIANATSRSILFRPRSKKVYFYPGERQWYSPFGGGSHEFMNNGELMLDDRIMFHYYATGITPAMAKPKVGTGSAYELTAHDSKGNYLDGSKTYKITLPSPIPAANFWSFMVYDGQTRSILETDQKTGGLDSNNPSVKPNKDGSYTMWFGPKAPNGREGNWIQTMPGKSWNVLLRIYGPEQAWFDKTWMPGDFELVE